MCMCVRVCVCIHSCPLAHVVRSFCCGGKAHSYSSSCRSSDRPPCALSVWVGGVVRWRGGGVVVGWVVLGSSVSQQQSGSPYIRGGTRIGRRTPICGPRETYRKPQDRWGGVTSCCFLAIIGGRPDRSRTHQSHPHPTIHSVIHHIHPGIPRRHP